MTATKDYFLPVKQNNGNTGWKERNSEGHLFQLSFQIVIIVRSTQLWLSLVTLELPGCDGPTWSKYFNPSNGLLYMAFPVACQLKAKHHVSWEGDPAKQRWQCHPPLCTLLLHPTLILHWIPVCVRRVWTQCPRKKYLVLLSSAVLVSAVKR